MNKSLDLIVETKMHKYDHTVLQFEKFLSNRELQEILENKADLNFVAKIASTKCSIDQFEKGQQKIKLLNSKIKHLSVMQTEIARTLVPDKFKNITSMMEQNERVVYAQHLEKMRKNSEILNQWINKDSIIEEDGYDYMHLNRSQNSSTDNPVRVNSSIQSGYNSVMAKKTQSKIDTALAKSKDINSRNSRKTVHHSIAANSINDTQVLSDISNEVSPNRNKKKRSNFMLNTFVGKFTGTGSNT